MNNAQYEKLEKELIPLVAEKLKAKYLYYNNALSLYFFKRKGNETYLNLTFKEMRLICEKEKS